MAIRRYTPSRPPEDLSEILSRLFTARGWGRRQDRLRLERGWVEAVSTAGATIAAHTQVGALRRGVLEVLVDSPVLLQELSHFHKRRLLQRLRERLPGTNITDLRFRVEVLGAPGAPGAGAPGAPSALSSNSPNVSETKAISATSTTSTTSSLRTSKKKPVPDRPIRRGTRS